MGFDTVHEYDGRTRFRRVIVETKVCYKCKLELPIDMFFKNKRRKDGLQSYCNVCNVAYTSKWRLENPEKARALDNKRRIKNPKKHNAKNAKWRLENKEQIKAINVKYVKSLTDRYIIRLLKTQIGIQETDLPSEMIEVKRLQIQIKHKLDDKKNENTTRY